MGGINSKFEVNADVAAATYVGLTITQTAAAITASSALTIATGAGLTTGEAAKGVVYLNTQLALLAADVALIRAKINA